MTKGSSGGCKNLERNLRENCKIRFGFSTTLWENIAFQVSVTLSCPHAPTLGIWGGCFFLLNLALPNRSDWYWFGKKFWGEHSKILLKSPGFSLLLNHAPCLTFLQLLKQSKAQAGQQIHQLRLLVHFTAVPKLEPNTHNVSLQVSARTLLTLGVLWVCNQHTFIRLPWCSWDQLQVLWV